jgi:hypothetical protein
LEGGNLSIQSAMPNPVDRRCFAFSLRTMFIGLTLIATVLGWLMWQRQIVRDRREMRDWLAAHGAIVVPNVLSTYLVWQIHGHPARRRNTNPSFRRMLDKKLELIGKSQGDHGSLPLVRRWFGDEYVEGICLRDALAERGPEIEILFSEATTVLDSAVTKELREYLTLVLSRPTRFALANVPLQDAMDYLMDLHGIEIRLDGDQTDESVEVSVQAENIPLDDALHKLLAPEGLTFAVRDNLVLIIKEAHPSP